MHVVKFCIASIHSVRCFFWHEQQNSHACVSTVNQHKRVFDRLCMGLLFQLLAANAIVSLFCVGGEVCRIGKRWVVNPSGGLESKGI